MLTLLCVLFLILGLVACSSSIESTTADIRGVTIVSDGNELSAGDTFYSRIRLSCGAESDTAPILVTEVADGLTPFLLGEDVQIIVKGEQRGISSYRFYKLIDSTWEQVYAESFVDLLEPGEYILEVRVSWGNSQFGREGQHFFRFTK